MGGMCKKDLIVMTCMTILTGCFNQQAPVIESAPIFATDSLKLTECAKFRLSSNVLMQDNVVQFFKCTGDDQKFSSLFKAIENVGPESWNHLT